MSTAKALAALGDGAVRDLLTVVLWSWSFVTRRVRWRDDDYLVARDGSVLPV